MIHPHTPKHESIGEGKTLQKSRSAWAGARARFGLAALSERKGHFFVLI